MDSHTLHTHSSASALSGRSRTIRHRGLSPRIPQGSEYLPSTEDDATSAADQQPRIVSQKAHTLCGSPLLPFSTLSKPLPGIPESSAFVENVFDAIPLSPRPKLHRRVSLEATGTGLSKVSRLPSPNYCGATRLETAAVTGTSYTGIFDFFKSPVSSSRASPTCVGSVASNSQKSMVGRYVSSIRDASNSSFEYCRNFQVPSMKRIRSHMGIPSFRSSGDTIPLQGRTRSVFSAKSSRSSHSTRTYASTSSLDSGRTYLFPGIETTDRFTHRWPKPVKLKKLERRDSCKPGSEFEMITVEESGSGSVDIGLGIEHYGRWTTHKWCLLLSVLSVLGYSIATLIYSILTWYQTWDHSDVMLVADGDVLILATVCASLLLLAALVGLTGTLLNSRPLLAIYVLLLWPAFASLLSVGYLSYKREVFALDRKLNLAWSQWYTNAGRAVIQESLRCCGFTDPTHEAFYGAGFAGGCHPRSPRPGCKGPLLRFERANLGSLWRTAFSATPLHIVNIIVPLLCANHVTRTFGTGLVPRGYRLSAADVRADAARLLEHFANDKEGAARVPPLIARVESGMPWRREDKVYRNGK